MEDGLTMCYSMSKTYYYSQTIATLHAIRDTVLKRRDRKRLFFNQNYFDHIRVMVT